MFSGLYSLDSNQNVPEDFPIGIVVTVPSNTHNSPRYVLAVPTTNHKDTDPMYTIQLLDGKTTTVPASIMPNIVNQTAPDLKITMPPWIHHDSKIRYTLGRITHQGRLQLSSNQWSFVVINKLGSILKEISLPNLPFNFQTLINDGTIQPGWESTPRITACHVSAKDLINPCPTSLSKALQDDNKDKETWTQSYSQEYYDLKKMDVYEEITSSQLHKIQHQCGRPIPTMCLLTIKYKDGYPDRAKCRIVVLGNQQQQSYTKGQKYAPVITQNQFRCLLSLAIQHKQITTYN